jgi:hypothetical protein
MNLNSPLSPIRTFPVPHPQLGLPLAIVPHLGADASVPAGPYHHQLIRLPGGWGRTIWSGPPQPPHLLLFLPAPSGSSFYPSPFPKGEDLGSLLSGATGCWVGLLRQGGATKAEGQRPGQCELTGTMKKLARGRDRHTQTQRHGERQRLGIKKPKKLHS